MRKLLFISLVAIFACATAYAKITGNKFTDSGFSISKPSDWNFIQNLKTYGIALTGDKITSAESGIIVAFGKNMGKGFSGVNPAVGVKLIDAPKGSTLVQWLTEEMKRQAASDKYYFQVSPALAMTIGGKSGAQSAYVNSTVVNGSEVNVYHVLYVMRSGGKVYLINMNCNDDLAHDFVGVFGKIAESIGPAPD